MKRKCNLSLIIILILILVPALSGCGGGKKGGGPGGNPGGNPGGGPGGTTYTPGQQSPAYTVGGVTFHMRYAPSATSLPTGTDDSGTGSVSNPFWIAETEVTYELWSVVYKWATGDTNLSGDIDGTETPGTYTIARVGVMGDGTGDTDRHPVTTVSWRDTIVWCNALTEYYYGNSDNCVYYENAAYTAPIRTSTNADVDTALGTQDNPYVKADAKGFRLPTSDEWELAARYHFKEGIQWLPGDHVSGDDTGYCYNSGISTTESLIFGKYAWYRDNSSSTHAVATTELKNALNLSDMSGNVWEWCFDWDLGLISLGRVLRGGCWLDNADRLRLGRVDYGNMVYAFSDLGFRPVRTQ